LSHLYKPKVCRLCHKPNKFANSHIIGRSFFRKIRGPFKHAVEVNLDAKQISTFRQAGCYDDQMLCLECEPKFSELDTYGFKVLGRPDVSRPTLSHGLAGTVEAYRIVGCDTDKLRKFILSVLWRASVSSLEFYDYVRLGPAFEQEIIHKVFSPDRLSRDDFTICVSKFDQNALGPYSGVLFPPLPHRDVTGMNCYSLYLPGLKIAIKVDHRPTPAFWWISAIQHPSEFTMPHLYGKRVETEWGFLQHMMERLRREGRTV
jgi:hypothetical protein